MKNNFDAEIFEMLIEELNFDNGSSPEREKESRFLLNIRED